MTAEDALKIGIVIEAVLASAKFGNEDTKSIQQATGTFLYCARAVDATMLLALSAIASDQVASTAETMKKILRFLDHVTTHLDAILIFSKSSLMLNVHSGTSYLCKSKVERRAGGNFFLSDNAKDPRDNGVELKIEKR